MRHDVKALIAALFLLPAENAFADNSNGPELGLETSIDWGDIDKQEWLAWGTSATLTSGKNTFEVIGDYERIDHETAKNEIWGLYRRDINDRFQVLGGARTELEPDSLTHLTLGVAGTFPFDIETEVLGFHSQDGDTSFRMTNALAIPLKGRLSAEPHFEINAFAQDVEELGFKSGFTDLQAGVVFQVEATPNLTPFVDIKWQRLLGETAQDAKAAGEDRISFVASAGIAISF